MLEFLITNLVLCISLYTVIVVDVHQAIQESQAHAPSGPIVEIGGEQVVHDSLPTTVDLKNNPR